MIGVACLPIWMSLDAVSKICRVQGIEEMLGPEEARDAVERLVVDEDGAEQRLLGLDVVGRAAERQRVVLGGGIRRRCLSAGSA